MIDDKKQLKALLLDGGSFGGFNIVDLEEVSQVTSKPVISVSKSEPDSDDFRKAIKKSVNYQKIFEKIDEPRKVEPEDGNVFIQFERTSFDRAEKFVKNSTLKGLTSEPLRVAHLKGKEARNLK